MRRLMMFLLIGTVFFAMFSLNCASQNNTKSNVTSDSATVTDSGREPDWVRRVPPSPTYYYYVGTGYGKNRAEAKKNATSDALSQASLQINATIDTNSSFSYVYQENTRTGDFSKTNSGFNKINVTGHSSFEKFHVQRIHYQDSPAYDTTCYVLAGVPKDEVDKAIERMKQFREEMKNSPTAIVAVSINEYAKKVFKNTKLSKSLQEYYQANGYYILPNNVSVGSLNDKKAENNISKIKGMLDKKFKRLIYVAITPERAFKETIRGYSFYVIEGYLTLEEVNLEDGSIVNSQIFNDKGIHKNGYNKAFSLLEQNLMNKLMGKGGSTGDYLDY